ncbi:MAG: exodeoxyribonuclease VII large subunit [Deltaproteobacteria bacterium]|nr:exodeoxyribonuclease VII large subunit [Deltaproteobacteria bacterium]
MAAQRSYRLRNLPGRPRPGAGSPEAMPAESGPRVYRVDELTREIKGLLEGRFARIQVRGEISGFKRATSGHCYLTLKDDDATLSAVIWRGPAARMRLDPRDGLEVIATGRITVYAPRGNYQLVIDRLEPAGEGALRAAFEQLRARLEEEGLFDEARKVALPPLPTRVGVVSSPTGAAIHDFLQVLGRRAPQVSVLLAPARVQGEGAASELASALRRLDAEDCDVIVVTRGGGSLEDLWAFNEELVVRAIAACETPVISAVGHEVDVTLSDLAADLRAATPSAAAELVAPARESLREELRSLRRRLQSALRLSLGRRRQVLLGARARLSDPRMALSARRQRLDELHLMGRFALERGLRERREALSREAARLERLHPRQRLGQRQRALADLERRLEREVLSGLRAERTRLTRHEAALTALSPQSVLDRGFALVSDQEGRLLRDAATVAVGDALQIRLARGALGARVSHHSQEASDARHPQDQEED